MGTTPIRLGLDYPPPENLPTTYLQSLNRGMMFTFPFQICAVKQFYSKMAYIDYINIYGPIWIH